MIEWAYGYVSKLLSLSMRFYVIGLNPVIHQQNAKSCYLWLDIMLFGLRSQIFPSPFPQQSILTWKSQFPGRTVGPMWNNSYVGCSEQEEKLWFPFSLSTAAHWSIWLLFHLQHRYMRIWLPTVKNSCKGIGKSMILSMIWSHDLIRGSLLDWPSSCCLGLHLILFWLRPEVFDYYDDIMIIIMVMLCGFVNYRILFQLRC